MTLTTPRTVAFKARERNIFFHLLTACNLSCRHCYINPAQHGTRTVSREEIESWLTIFAKADKQSNVIFLGGEPTLHPDLPFAVRTANRLGYQTVTIDTNGYLHHDLLNQIEPGEAVLSFSLDGPNPEVNDPIRGQGVFETCTTNLAKAVQAGFETSLIYTVSAMNIDHLKEMPLLLKKLGVDHFFIQIIGLRGNSAQDNAADGLQLTPAQWLSTVPGIARQAAELGLHVIYPKVFLDEDEEFQCAGIHAENYFIFPNGRVYQCPLCEDHPINTFQIEENILKKNPGLVEEGLFSLEIPEGCVMNKLLQPGNLEYLENGQPKHRISCCLLKQEIGQTAKL